MLIKGSVLADCLNEDNGKVDSILYQVKQIDAVDKTQSV